MVSLHQSEHSSFREQSSYYGYILRVELIRFPGELIELRMTLIGLGEWKNRIDIT